MKEYPFTRPPAQLQSQRTPPDAATRRQIIRSKLHSDMALSKDDFKFMEEHPDEAKWLKDHIELKFWLRFEFLLSQYVRDS